jgi:hypothetical protein
MSDEKKIKGKLEVAGITGPIWFMGWLFTIGFADLHVVKAIFALVLWPYYLGSMLS